MKKLLMLLVASILITVVIPSCNKEKIVAPEYTVLGSWVRLITDSQGVQFHAELKINTDGTFDFILLDTVTGHNNSSGEYTLTDNLFTIVNDADCGGNGAYEYVVSESKIAFVAMADSCVPRVGAMQGVWSKK